MAEGGNEEQKTQSNLIGKTKTFGGTLGGRPSCEEAPEVHSVGAVLLSFF